MAAEPRVTARDPVESGGREGWKRQKERKRKREVKGSEGFLFQISPDPQGTSALAASSIPK